MNDDPTLEQVRRIRQLLFNPYSAHWHACPICQGGQPCAELDRLLLVQAKWAMRDYQLQWAMLDRESEGV